MVEISRSGRHVCINRGKLINTPSRDACAFVLLPLRRIYPILPNAHQGSSDDNDDIDISVGIKVRQHLSGAVSRNSHFSAI